MLCLFLVTGDGDDDDDDSVADDAFTLNIRSYQLPVDQRFTFILL
jgi:hypothetical protein